LILKTCALVDATLLRAARRAPVGYFFAGDGDAGYTVKQGQPRYGYMAHLAVDETHKLILQVTLTAANMHDGQEFEKVVNGDEAFRSRERSEWCGQHGVANGILRKPSRGQKLRPPPCV
jgi:IS5 family transposase